ncbi:hypothetical protein BD410DRAFT_806730 [Rickenella mellea]|uniref:Uncharacterized protein n=1 Tax=Rickenella mellea TaxID=50990 RepID=A0A4Y7PTK3_9AGAM|nr:hypothetical protein BD410DRAFT_806730 [Rickenella mellea]
MTAGHITFITPKYSPQKEAARQDGRPYCACPPFVFLPPLLVWLWRSSEPPDSGSGLTPDANEDTGDSKDEKGEAETIQTFKLLAPSSGHPSARYFGSHSTARKIFTLSALLERMLAVLKHDIVMVVVVVVEEEEERERRRGGCKLRGAFCGMLRGGPVTMIRFWRWRGRGWRLNVPRRSW